jgi:neurotransmitter:Na+ symporter, NSS family
VESRLRGARQLQTWLAAAGQIFFSLSVGFGVIINYASYMKKKDDVVLSGLTANATNELFEVGFGGLITLTAAFVFLGLSGTTARCDRLVRPRLQHAAGRLRPDGGARNIIGALWFFMLFLAAITSSLSMYRRPWRTSRKRLNWTHTKSTT